MVSLPESLQARLRTIANNRREQDVAVRRINKLHFKLSQYPIERVDRLDDKLWTTLQDFYETAIKLANQEETECTACIRELESLVPPNTNGVRRKDGGGFQKRKRLKTESNGSPLLDSSAGAQHSTPGTPPVLMTAPPPAQGNPRVFSSTGSPRIGESSATWNYSIGDQVAARVSNNDALKDEWIVVKVTGHNRDADMVDVIDEEPGDEEEASGQRKYSLPPSSIIPLPKPMDAALPDFAAGTLVLAVYPGTTALYRASVLAGRKRKADDYLLAFDDDEEDGTEGLPTRQVPLVHVVPLPEGHRQ
eukprot:TRINITY_DN13293_c1_g1_i1.p1 TRINITY_DN13293_c1_g1~~TRINITY_DN13293_c1_g1_i1.p1  ORF type:complete len:305 (-),score=63.10 TRINITY_DN13293_c1_g1_i1:1528-2442(-)